MSHLVQQPANRLSNTSATYASYSQLSKKSNLILPDEIRNSLSPERRNTDKKKVVGTLSNVTRPAVKPAE